MQAIIFIGIPASGKSSFYKERFFRTHVRINLDMLRTRRRERILLAACLEAKQPFVVDNTNVTREERARYIAPAKAAGIEVIGYYFQSQVKEAIARNSARPEGERIPRRLSGANSASWKCRPCKKGSIYCMMFGCLAVSFL